MVLLLLLPLRPLSLVLLAIDAKFFVGVCIYGNAEIAVYTAGYVAINFLIQPLPLLVQGGPKETLLELRVFSGLNSFVNNQKSENTEGGALLLGHPFTVPHFGIEIPDGSSLADFLKSLQRGGARTYIVF